MGAMAPFFDILDSNNIMAKGHVKLLCGISGSGKTTYADSLVKNQGYIKLSIDEYMWHDHGECGTDYPAEEYRTRYAISEQKLREQLEAQITEGRDVVVDMTFCHRDKRDSYRKLLNEIGAGWELIYFPVDFDTAWKRINLRNGQTATPNRARVTKEMLTMFYNGFQRPGPDESYLTASSSSTDGDS